MDISCDSWFISIHISMSIYPYYSYFFFKWYSRNTSKSYRVVSTYYYWSVSISYSFIYRSCKFLTSIKNSILIFKIPFIEVFFLFFNFYDFHFIKCIWIVFTKSIWSKFDSSFVCSKIHWNSKHHALHLFCI